MLVVGAGTAGNLVIRAMLDGTVRGYRPVGIVDDDPAKLGTLLHGVPVVGLGDDLAAAARRSCAPRSWSSPCPRPATRDYYRLVNAARAAGLAVKTTPDLQQILQGGRAVARIEDVRMEDLLQRRPVRNDLPEVRAFLAGRTVLVTGAAGSIGSELCRQVGEYDVARLVCLDNNETGLFRLENDLRERLPQLEVVPFLGDIRDRSRMTRAAGVVPARDRLPRRGLQARPHAPVPPAGGDPQQRRRHRPARRAGRPRGRRGLRAHQHRQGREPDQRHGRHQAHRRAHHPRAQPAQRDALLRHPLRQRPGQQRQRGRAVPAPDPRGPAR